MIEKRRYYRLNHEVKVVYKIINRLQEFNSGSFDIGGGGICIQTFERIEPGTNLELNLMLPQDKEPFLAYTRVVWQGREPKKEKNGKEYYETGVEFLKVDLKNRLQIIHYVHTSLKDRVKKLIQ